MGEPPETLWERPQRPSGSAYFNLEILVCSEVLENMIKHFQVWL